MEVGENVHLWHGEVEAPVVRVVVGAVLPGREDVVLIARSLRLAVPPCVLSESKSPQQGTGSGAEQGAVKQGSHHLSPQVA